MQQLQDILNQQFSFVLQNTAANFNNAVLPTSSFCFSRVLFNEETTLPVVDNSPAEVVIGNTGTEALSAWLNKQLNGTDNKIEEQIEALQILSKMAGKNWILARHLKKHFMKKVFCRWTGEAPGH